MKNRTKFSVIFAFTVVLLSGLTAQMVFADVVDEDKYPYEAEFMRKFIQSDIPGIEKLLQDHVYQMDLGACLNSVVANYYLLPSSGKSDVFFLNYNKQLLLPLLRILVSYGADCNSKISFIFYNNDGRTGKLCMYDDDTPLFSAVAGAVEGNLSLQIIEFLLENGANPNVAAKIGVYPIEVALDHEDIKLARLLLEYGANINIASAFWLDGRSLLMVNGQAGRYSSVRFLVENGAKINQTSNEGKTAAQFAYERGEIDIYNYLVAHGATWTAPSQTARANPNQPSAPAQAPSYSFDSFPAYDTPSAPAQSSNSTPTQSSGERIAQALTQGLQQVQDTLRGSLDTGRYRVSGGAEEITFTGMANNGNLYYKDASGKTSSGTYSINGDRITMNILGRSYFYTITSRTSFSGNGEEWYYAGR